MEYDGKNSRLWDVITQWSLPVVRQNGILAQAARQKVTAVLTGKELNMLYDL